MFFGPLPVEQRVIHSRKDLGSGFVALPPRSRTRGGHRQRRHDALDRGPARRAVSAYRETPAWSAVGRGYDTLERAPCETSPRGRGHDRFRAMLAWPLVHRMVM